MRTFAFFLLVCSCIALTNARLGAENDKVPALAELSNLPTECSWLGDCMQQGSETSRCGHIPLQRWPCECLTPVAKCMFDHWKTFSMDERDSMLEQCGGHRYPFSVYMHYINQRQCPFEKILDTFLDQEREVQRENALKYSCGWIVNHYIERETKLHSKLASSSSYTACARVPGWVQPTNGTGLNFTEYVVNKLGNDLFEWQVWISKGDAGVDYHFYTKPGHKSDSGKVEPHSRPPPIKWASLVSPTWTLGNSMQYPDDNYLAEELHYVLEMKNRNYFHDAYVKFMYAPYCGNAVGSDISSFCTNGSTFWDISNDTPFFAVNGCKVDGDTPVCLNGGSTEKQKSCGYNCFDCKNACN